MYYIEGKFEFNGYGLSLIGSTIFWKIGRITKTRPAANPTVKITPQKGGGVHHGTPDNKIQCSDRIFNASPLGHGVSQSSSGRSPS